MTPEKAPTQLAVFQEIVIMPMDWQQGKVVELDNEQHKQFHPGR